MQNEENYFYINVFSFLESWLILHFILNLHFHTKYIFR